MHWWTAILIPVIGAFIGWVTNLIAVKAIFKPYRPIHILGLPWTIQGVVPKRRAELARSIGEVVEKELLKVEDLINQMKSPEVLDKIVLSANDSIRNMVVDRIPPWVPVTIKTVILEMMGDMLNKQMPQVINQIVDQAGRSVIEKVRLAQLVEERLNAYDIKYLEKIILSVAARELKHIEIIGGVLGFIIGLVQVAIVYLAA
ncbi:DUF445 domain-containing protein [Desulforamulus hydrothermalis]|uniref:DUF445 family protein n=1 Tax=Desulforamulus hydrothermalis Lam5 = DSM 18033 TaxID=1121428 RepID=K8DXD6_9FIRM|nr:DUF445 family protein [Desulforamulus hydrothermalis]CCO07272.1 conserved hypothetical protein [Desulforamulus hydrothermalis Lam5 = DSM 18033]SHG92845.1 Protein of unknown function [Desulforamulus hydrothermalis Lam5 = DSM 18033]